MVKKRTPHIWHFSFQFYKNARVNFYVPWLNNLPHFPLISDIHPQSLKKETFYTNTSKQMLLGCINSGRRTPLTRLACNPKCGVSCNFFIKKNSTFPDRHPSLLSQMRPNYRTVRSPGGAC
jgi:hypothetical protein